MPLDQNGFQRAFLIRHALSGVYGLNFRRDGFYPENATGYEYTVNAGWESVYAPKQMEKCSNGNCDPKLRLKRPSRSANSD